MLSTIDFDHKPPLKADKVDDVGPKGHLPAKLDAIEPAVAQQEPKLAFGISRNSPHGARIPAPPRWHGLMMRWVWHEPLTRSSALKL